MAFGELIANLRRFSFNISFSGGAGKTTIGPTPGKRRTDCAGRLIASIAILQNRKEMSMNFIRASALISLLFAFCCGAIAQVRDQATASQVIESVVTVVDVDRQARVVTVRGPEGEMTVFKVPEEAQNLDLVNPGARFQVRYLVSVAVAISKGGSASASSGRTVTMAPKGDIPGGVIVNVNQITGVVESVDYDKRLMSVRGPQGNLLVVTADQEVQGLDQIQVGDTISVEYTESLAMQMIKQ